MACTTLAEALEHPTLHQLVKHTSFVEVVAEIAVVIEKGMEGFAPARKLSPGHIMDWAQKLARNWSHESLADLVVFLQNPGKYDRGEFYASVDVERITKWWEAFLLEKADARAARHAGLVNAPDPWDQMADELNAMLRSRGAGQPGIEEADRERFLRAEMAELDRRRFATADGWKKLRTSLAMERAPVINKSADHDRIRREVPAMTADQLREAWKKHPDGWSRRIILQEANHRGLVEQWLRNKMAAEDPGKAEAADLISHGPVVPLPPDPSPSKRWKKPPPQCDYRRADCSNEGKTIGGVWVCSNHQR